MSFDETFVPEGCNSSYRAITIGVPYSFVSN